MAMLRSLCFIITAISTWCAEHLQEAIPLPEKGCGLMQVKSIRDAGV